MCIYTVIFAYALNLIYIFKVSLLNKVIYPSGILIIRELEVVPTIEVYSNKVLALGRNAISIFLWNDVEHLSNFSICSVHTCTKYLITLVVFTHPVIILFIITNEHGYFCLAILPADVVVTINLSFSQYNCEVLENCTISNSNCTCVSTFCANSRHSLNIGRLYAVIDKVTSNYCICRYIEELSEVNT